MVGEELEGDQGEWILAGGLLGVKVPPNGGGGYLTLADGQEALNVGPLLAMGREAAQEQLVYGLPLELTAFEQRAQDLQEEGLAGPEEAADPYADALLVVAIRRIGVTIQDYAEVALPLGRDDKVRDLTDEHARISIGHLDDRLYPLLYGRGERVTDSHHASSPR